MAVETLRLGMGGLPEPKSLMASVRSFVYEPKAATALVILGLLLLMAIFAPLLAPYGFAEQDVTASRVQPGAEHLMGTDILGRDILSRIIYGARISLRIGFISVGIAAGVGVPTGAIAGYYGGWWDEILMRLTDAMIAFPNLIFLMGVVAVLGPGTTNVMIALGLNAFPLYARLTRGQTLSVKQRDYVSAARALGGTDLRIMARHIMPNAVQPLIVQGSLALGTAVLAESSLSFLGIGISPPTPTWGVIISEGFALIRTNPWISVAPGFFIVAFVLSVNLLGDRLRDVFDPRLRGTR
ncbi:MAG: ABC transporter permease [Dehalococcoidia bacterium]|jgi:ABC-type dipeptide/oligopeptide/nickel transport system permease subunit|nr:ABC transporter permease [Dehalococcoidia bacterium]